MRKQNVTIAGLFSGGIALAAAATAVLVTSCTGDDNTVTADGGNDGTTDGFSAAETGPDVHVTADSGDAGSADGGDSGADGEAAALDANFDAPPINQFPPAVTAAYCMRLQQCCLVPDGGWNENSCESLIGMGGGIRNIELHEVALTEALDSGIVAYNKAAVPKCLQDIAAIPCGTLAASTILGIQNDCYAALQGTLGVDAGPCTDPIECQTNEYCRFVGDAAAGTCVPLIPQGQPCTDVTNSTDCTYLGNGTSPALYCDPAGSTCQPPAPLGDSGCNSNAACASGSCSSPNCVSSYVFSDPGTPDGLCALFLNPDAGDSGGD
jgi:hypothetical protein